MKKITVGFIFATICGLWFFNMSYTRELNENGVMTQGFAVVELFTSEGCSSCPPADRLLSDIVAETREKNQAVYALSFHVDYWDYIGWQDPYARAAFSQRQRQYAEAFNSSRIYTPQMIVNGQKEFVGSSRTKAWKAIESALRQQAPAEIKIVNIEKNETSVSMLCNITGAPESAVLNVAIVEQGLSQNVSRGENRGRTLRHENVVRAFSVERVRATGNEMAITFPKGIKPENVVIIAYVQLPHSMEIIAAASAEF